MNSKRTNVLKLPKNSSSSAFTIVELLIVIVIIGILAAITIVSYTGITARANQASLQSDLTNNAKKLGLYYALYGAYPNLDPSTKCPIAPSTIDDKYCLKPSNSAQLDYKAITPYTTYTLSISKSNQSYGITDKETVKNYV